MLLLIYLTMLNLQHLKKYMLKNLTFRHYLVMLLKVLLLNKLVKFKYRMLVIF